MDFFAASLALVLTLLRPVASMPASAPSSSITVEVFAYQDKKPVTLPGARVSLLSQTKCEIATAQTNAEGLATLPFDTKANPKYLLVELDGFFITGTQLRGVSSYVLEMHVYSLSSEAEGVNKLTSHIAEGGGEAGSLNPKPRRATGGG